MALQVKNSRELLDPSKFRFKVLLYGLSGLGKTEWGSGADDPAGSLGIAACETGHGKGLLTVAQKGIDFIEPQNLAELEAFANGAVFKDKTAVMLDSISYMNKTFIRDAALALPRRSADSAKRLQGIPELDDYGTMAEMTRRVLAKLLDQDRHLVCIATEKHITPDPETGVTEHYVLPDLPGALAFTCTAMFDFVLRIRSRQRLLDPKDAKSRVVERFVMSQPDGQGTVVKCRANSKGVPFLPKEFPVNLNTGEGGFQWCLSTILERYKNGT